MDIDHIFPFVMYDVEGAFQQRQVMHFTNLQPLDAAANKAKHDKLPTKVMAAKVACWAWPVGIVESMLPDSY